MVVGMVLTALSFVLAAAVQVMCVHFVCTDEKQISHPQTSRLARCGSVTDHGTNHFMFQMFVEANPYCEQRSDVTLPYYCEGVTPETGGVDVWWQVRAIRAARICFGPSSYSCSHYW